MAEEPAATGATIEIEQPPVEPTEEEAESSAQSESATEQVAALEEPDALPPTEEEISADLADVAAAEGAPAEADPAIGEVAEPESTPADEVRAEPEAAEPEPAAPPEESETSESGVAAAGAPEDVVPGGTEPALVEPDESVLTADARLDADAGAGPETPDETVEPRDELAGEVSIVEQADEAALTAGIETASEQPDSDVTEETSDAFNKTDGE